MRIPGKTEEIPWIRFDRIGVRDSVNQFAVLLTPFRHQSPAVSVLKISDRHFTVTSAGSVDHLIFANGRFADGRIETDGVFVRLKEQDGADTRFAVVDGTFLKYGGRTLWHSSTPASGEGTLPRMEVE